MKSAISCFFVYILTLEIFYSLSTNALIVPDEIPSLLSVIYSNIPVIKKGTDSRLGWGFRLGNRADVQVLVELGPQTYTKKLQNQKDTNTVSKRQSVNSLRDVLYAKNKRKTIDTDNYDREIGEISSGSGEEWLKSWKKSIGKKKTENGLSIGEIDAKSVFPKEDDER